MGRPGDWDCSCGVSNFASRYECFKCRAKNPSGGGRGRGGHRGRGRGGPSHSRESNVNHVVENGGAEDNNQNGREQGGHQKRGNIPVFGFRRLHGFLTEDVDKVILSIDMSLSDWAELIESKLTADSFILIIHVMGEKVCSESILHQQKMNIIAKTLGPTFSSKWAEKCAELFMSPHDQTRQRRNENDLVVDHSRYRILQNLHNIFTFVASKMPTTTIDYVQRLIPGIIGLLCSTTDNVDAQQLLAKFLELKDTINLLVKRKNEEQQEAETEARVNRRGQLTARQEEELHAMTPPNEFREMPIVPSMKEIMSVEETFLRTNKERGAYNNSDHYLDVQFRLLREDFMQPLKNGIHEFMKHKHDYLARKKKMPLGNVRIYPGVQLRSIQLIRDSITYSLQLPENSYKRIKWNRSKRLLQGSLLVLTSDDFASAYFGIVAKRDLQDLDKGIFDVVWEGPSPDLERKGEEFLMVECEVYFEAYRYTLQILKEIPLETFHMSKFIVYGSSDVKPPKYLETTDQLMNIDGRYFSPLQGPWPNAKELRLDDTQFEAFHAALTSEFAIVQGPPGTGKTFLGLKLAEVFLNNLPMWWGEDSTSGSGPILVVCYTNHALDQFLEEILDKLKVIFPKEDPAMIRVGGRSKSESLQEHSLLNKRIAAGRLNRFDASYKAARYEAVATVREKELARASAMNEVVGLDNLEGIIRFDCLEVWGTKLKDEFPNEIWNLISNPTEMGMKPADFESPQFSADQKLKQWFKFLDAPKVPIYPAKAPQAVKKVQGSNPENEEEAEDDDEEEDEETIEELQMNRMLEDFSGDSGVRIDSSGFGSRLKCISGASLKEFENKLETNEITITQIESFQRMTNKDKQVKVREIREQSRVVRNQKEFLEKLFAYYKADLFDLPSIENLLNPTPGEARSLSNLKLMEKWALYFGLVKKAKVLTTQLATSIQSSLIEAQKKLKDIQNYGDGFLLKRTKIVGMTTTGAAKYNDLLKMMKSKIVIVEEAAEVLESHIVTCITQHCEHLILIGDHQQLRPSTTVYELSKKYHLDISLFERMLNNDLHCHKLKVQHRMRPEICDLVVGTIYKELENHPTVYNYPEVYGTAKNLFFIKHCHHEKAEADSMSKSNSHEAIFLARLCRYLVQQGYKTDKITIITTYTGQMFLIKQELRGIPTCKGVRVTVVDNFQGEENDIILLSLVRSNEESKIGFLSTDNRICVAISRAKHGMFICGNMNLLSQKSKTWKQIERKLSDRGEIGESLELICQIHKTHTQVTNAKDFDNVPEGGCLLICQANLSCGHQCESVCHIDDRDHIVYKCKLRCTKICKNNHQCQFKCFQSCPPCPVLMEKTLPCQHVKQLACHVVESAYICRQLVSKVLPCGHVEDLPCFKDPKQIQCKIKVDKTLRCGHEKRSIECYIDASTINCKVNVEKILVPCGHTQVAACHLHPEMIKCETILKKKLEPCEHTVDVKCQYKDKPTPCKTPCPTRLECGHACTKICHILEDPEHVDYICRKDCGRRCANGHTCKAKHKCFKTPCPPCIEVVEKTMSCKIHKSQLKCHVDPASQECLFPCNKSLGCGHKCQKLCSQPCFPCVIPENKRAPCGHQVEIPCSLEPTQALCEQLVKSYANSPCNHEIYVPCKLQLQPSLSPEELVKYCTHPCGYKFDEKGGGCGHTCKGTCADCRQGRFHKKCQEKCERALICGHVCSSPCSAACPPCRKECNLKCEHSSCARPCGEPCNDCAEKCNWKCEHKECSKLCSELCDRGPCDEPCPKKLKCSHDCIGFCGEVCPPKCRICDKEEVTEIFLGNEDVEDSRFVYLEDCGHFIEREGLNNWVKPKTSGEILAKSCPKCKTLIRRSRRYGNAIRESIHDVMTVKKLAFGNPLHRQKMTKDILSQVREKKIWEELLPELRKFVIDKLVVLIPKNIGGGGNRKADQFCEKKVDINTLASIQTVVKYGNDTIKLLTDEKAKDLKLELLESLKKKFHGLFQMFIGRQMPFTAIEIRDFDKEFQRLFDLKQVYLRRSCERFTDGHSVAAPLYTRVMSIILSPRIYAESMKNEIYGLLKAIDDCLKTGLGISERERLQILQAIGMAAGRWFKCPNGHIYIITECGGAMEEAQCNECKATIGGGSHRLRSDNAIATEMDGATAPLYPNMVG